MTTHLTDPLSPILSQLFSLQSSLGKAQAHLDDAWKRYNELALNLMELKKALEEKTRDPSSGNS